jgi:hypothetical protein
MDTFLTLVIALGGIATGIGAIWAAMLARSQARLTERSLDEQRQSFQEQTEIARRQAELTEQSLAQTERSLAEQNERARLNLELDLLTRLADRFESPHFLSRRREAAKYLLDNAFLEEDTKMVEVPSLNRSVIDVCSLFEDVGELLRLGVLSIQSVWTRFGVPGKAYWYLCKPGIEKVREEWEDPSPFEEFEYLSRMWAEVDDQRGIGPPTPEQVHQIMEAEAAIGGEEPPATTEREGG